MLNKPNPTQTRRTLDSVLVEQGTAGKLTAFLTLGLLSDELWTAESRQCEITLIYKSIP